MATVQAALAADGPLTRSQLRERVAAVGVRTGAQAMVHILALASIRGLIVRDPVTGREQAFVLAQDWPTRYSELTAWLLATHLRRRHFWFSWLEFQAISNR